MNVALVFGGSGFLGSALIRYLLEKNLIVIAYKHSQLGNLQEIKNENLIIIDSLEITPLLHYKIDIIYHLASVTIDPSYSYNDYYDSNVKLTQTLIKLTKTLHIPQFIYVSTGSIFSKPIKNTIFDEITVPNPKNYYGLTKYIAETLLEIEFSSSNTHVAIIRFPSIFGTKSSIGIIHDFYNYAIHNEAIEVYSNGERLRNLIYIDSAVEILYLLFQSFPTLDKFEIFMAGSSNSLKIIDIAKLIVQHINSKSKIIPVNSFSPSDFDVLIDTSKVEKKLGFSPISIEDGLKKYIKVIQNEHI